MACVAPKTLECANYKTLSMQVYDNVCVCTTIANQTLSSHILYDFNYNPLHSIPLNVINSHTHICLTSEQGDSLHEWMKESASILRRLRAQEQQQINKCLMPFLEDARYVCVGFFDCTPCDGEKLESLLRQSDCRQPTVEVLPPVGVSGV